MWTLPYLKLCSTTSHCFAEIAKGHAAHRPGQHARKIQDPGIGPYIRNLMRHLARLDSENRYALIARPQDKEFFRDLPDNFRPSFETSPVYSVRELFGLSWQLWRS